jgi:predicted metal-binding protein
MPTPVSTICTNSAKRCLGTCSGYGTTCTCPPLIVLAVLATTVTASSAPAAGVDR